ncbi:cytochrome b [Inhella sp.]|uniref:cytochrome b n=1 Tax=Inhella sp. TaxID=1921806 RepID=UPI0035AFBBF2
MQSSPHRYSRPAVLLHWLMAIGLLGAIGMGLYVSDLPMGLQRLKLINWHKWAGITLLLLVIVRTAWRAGHRLPPDLPMPAWQARAAHAVHGLLYLLMFGVPLLGWAYSNAAGFPVVWFGVLPLPDFVGKNPELAEVLKGLHKLAAWSLLLLILAHAAAAIKHQFVDRDRLLDRMKF